MTGPMAIKMFQDVPVVFLSLFSLFWIRDLLFGMRLMLLSDGFMLRWQDRKASGSVSLADIRKVLIGTKGRGGRRFAPLRPWPLLPPPQIHCDRRSIHGATSGEESTEPTMARMAALSDG